MAATKGKALVRYCEARTRRGTACKRPAGWGTGHPGRGRCVKHGGKTPNHEKKNAREEAFEFVVGQLGAQAQIDPLDAAVKAVELANGAVEHWRRQLALAYESNEAPKPVVVEGFRMALQDLSRMTEAANRAGVADRIVALTERFADQLALVFEEAVAGEKLEPAVRARMVARYGAGLAQLEQAQLPPGD